MIRRILAIFLGIFLAAAGGIVYVFSQDTERSAFISYVEEQISTPNFQIRLNGIDGALSSDVSFQSITIADRDGIWLEVINPRLVWSRTALLGGRLLVESLVAEKIDVKRRPLPDESAPSPESTSFSIPELPVAVILEELDLPIVELGPDVINLVSQVSVTGRLILDDGSLDLDFNVERLGDIQGTLSALVKYEGSSQDIELDIKLVEPENGIIASAIGLTGRPPVALSIEGNAPLSELDVTLAFDVDDTRILDGNAGFSSVSTGLKVRTNLSGPIGSLFPPTQKELFAGQSRFLADMIFHSAGGFEITDARLNSTSVNIGLGLRTTMDGFLSKLDVRGLIAQADNLPVLLSENTSLSNAQLIIDYDAASQNTWQGSLRVNDFQQTDLDNNQIEFGAVEFDGFGTVLNFEDAAAREISFDIDGVLSGLNASDPAIKDAFGDRLALQLDGDWQSQNPLLVKRFDVSGNGLSVAANGQFEQHIFTGLIKGEIKALEAFSGLSGSDLQGGVSFSAQGDIAPLSGGFDLVFDGLGTDLGFGLDKVDPLFNGQTKLKGGMSRNEDGLAFKELSVVSDQLSARFDGSLSSQFADLAANARLQNLAFIDETSTGAVDLIANLKGSDKPFALDAKIQMPSGVLVGQNVDNLALELTGALTDDTFTGDISSSGFLAKQLVDISGQISSSSDALKLDNLNALIGGTQLGGYLARDGKTGLFNSQLDISGRDISAIAALGLVKATGSVDGQITLAPEQQSQSAEIDLRLAGLTFNGAENGTQIDSGQLMVRANDLFGKPQINAELRAKGIEASGVQAKSLFAKIENRGTESDFQLTSDLVHNNANIDLSGTVNQLQDKTDIVVEDFTLTSDIGWAELLQTTQISLADGVTSINPTAINVSGGRIELGGTVGDEFKLDVSASDVPLSIINTFNPQLNAGGTLGGNAQIRGASSAPVISYNLTGNRLTASQLSQYNVSSLNLSAVGDFQGQTLSVSNLSVQNNQGINLSARGKVPLSGNGLNLKVFGNAPINIAEQFLLERGTQLDGQATLDLSVTGALVAPTASGQLNVAGASITDPLSNIRIVGANLQLNLQGSNQARVTFEGNLASGGTLSSSGTIGLNGQLPANVNLRLRSVRYSDLETFSTLINGDLNLEGELLASPLLSGNLNIGRTEISVPESFASDADLLSVEHINEDRSVRRTLDRIDQVTPSGDGGSSSSGNLRLNLVIDAPNQIFVRGRGLDAELEGRLVLTGSLSNPVPLGGFLLRRGRLEILGQRFDLTEGSISLQGDLDPLLDFTAETVANDTQNYILLNGKPTNLQVTFSSDPELPEDEILANIIFGRSLDDLSPTQIIRLAAVANELTGGSSPSLVEGLRQSTGLDDVDVTQDSDGNLAINAGKYVSDNIYLGTKTGQDETEATINLDITDSLKATGSVNTDGESTLGIFFEKDY